MNTVRKILSFLTVFLCIVFACCRQPDVLHEQTERMADLECRAISLREQRFSLANSIRFTQDTLIHLKTNVDSARLAQKLIVLNNQKEDLLQNSLRLADTIHLSLDSLRKYTFKTTEDKKRFDKELKELLMEKGCKTD